MCNFYSSSIRYPPPVHVVSSSATSPPVHEPVGGASGGGSRRTVLANCFELCYKVRRIIPLNLSLLALVLHFHDSLQPPTVTVTLPLDLLISLDIIIIIISCPSTQRTLLLSCLLVPPSLPCPSRVSAIISFVIYTRPESQTDRAPSLLKTLTHPHMLQKEFRNKGTDFLD